MRPGKLEPEPELGPLLLLLQLLLILLIPAAAGDLEHCVFACVSSDMSPMCMHDCRLNRYTL